VPGHTRPKLFKLIKELSFARKKIKLASGRESNFYFDLKPTMFHPEGAGLIAELLFEKLRPLQADYIGGLAVGAVPLLSPLAMVSFAKGKPLPAFFVRKEIKEHGTRRLIEGAGDLSGKNVVILEDVATTGGSAMLAVEAAKAAGASVILVLAVVDREEGAAEFFAEQGVKFDSLFKAGAFLAG
jgi:orotate phosphoribosyltransferase